jgi:hypothetical protein
MAAETCRVSSGTAGHTQHVVLALCSNGAPDPTLVEALRLPYAAMFSEDCPLDMAFRCNAQELQIESICPPFYNAS